MSQTKVCFGYSQLTFWRPGKSSLGTYWEKSWVTSPGVVGFRA